LELGRAPVASLPPAARIFGDCHSTIVSGCPSQETSTKIRAAGGITPPPGKRPAAAPLTAPGNGCARTSKHPRSTQLGTRIGDADSTDHAAIQTQWRTVFKRDGEL